MMKRTLQNFLLYCHIIFNKLVARFKPKRNKGQTLLIIKVDVIGDYILARNFFAAVRHSPRYKNARITLLGNELWRDLAMNLDRENIDDFLWIDRIKYRKFAYKKDVLLQFSKKKFDEVVVFHYSRSLFSDILAFTVNAKKKTGMGNDFSILNRQARMITDRIYYRLVSIPGNTNHEFVNNRLYIKEVAGDMPEVHYTKPVIDLDDAMDVHSIFGITKNYILLSPGAGEPRRRLPDSALLLVIEELFKQGQFLVFTGTGKDIRFMNLVKEAYPQYVTRFTDLVAKTTLMQVLYLVKQAKHIICHESSIYHIGIALQKPVICFAGGGHFKKWADYGGIENVTLVFEPMPCFNCNWLCIYKAIPGESYPCIQAIPVAKVVAAVQGLPISP